MGGTDLQDSGCGLDDHKTTIRGKIKTKAREARQRGKLRGECYTWFLSRHVLSTSSVKAENEKKIKQNNNAKNKTQLCSRPPGGSKSQETFKSVRKERTVAQVKGTK